MRTAFGGDVALEAALGRLRGRFVLRCRRKPGSAAAHVAETDAELVRLAVTQRRGNPRRLVELVELVLRRPAHIDFGPRLGVPVLVDAPRLPRRAAPSTCRPRRRSTSAASRACRQVAVELRRIDLIRQLLVGEAAERDRRVRRRIDDRERRPCCEPGSASSRRPAPALSSRTSIL